MTNPHSNQDEQDTVDEFVEELLAQAPVLVTHDELAEYKARAHRLFVPPQPANTEAISLCPICCCMTRTVEGEFDEQCGKCGGDKTLGGSQQPANTLPTTAENCVFCKRIENGEYDDRFANHVMFTPLNPVVEGHKLIVPVAHTANLNDGPLEANQTGWALRYFTNDLEQYNLITSKGADATQTIQHLHFHIVPRRKGDGLFLPWTDQNPLPSSGVFFKKDLPSVLENVHPGSLPTTPIESDAWIDEILDDKSLYSATDGKQGRSRAECKTAIQAQLDAAVRRTEKRGVLAGRKAECDYLMGAFQYDDSLTPDEYEALLAVLNDRLTELDKPNYRKNATWTA